LGTSTNKIIYSRSVEFFEYNPGDFYTTHCFSDHSNFIPNYEIWGNNYNNSYYYNDSYTKNVVPNYYKNIIPENTKNNNSNHLIKLRKNQNSSNTHNNNTSNKNDTTTQNTTNSSPQNNNTSKKLFLMNMYNIIQSKNILFIHK